jgi:hypothetical protein
MRYCPILRRRAPKEDSQIQREVYLDWRRLDYQGSILRRRSEEPERSKPRRRNFDWLRDAGDEGYYRLGRGHLDRGLNDPLREGEAPAA